MSILKRLDGPGRRTVETVRAGWDDDSTNDQRIKLYDPRGEKLEPSKSMLPKGVIDGFVTPAERRSAVLDPAVEALVPQAKKNEAHRMLELQESTGLPVSKLKAFTDQVRDAATFQVRMSPEALLGFLEDGRFKTAYEVKLHHDKEPVTDAYVKLRKEKEDTTGLQNVVYASVTWDAVSRDATSPYGGVILVLRNDRIFDRVSITERETFAYVTDAQGFKNDVVTWNQVGSLVTHFMRENHEPAGNFERTGSAPHIEAQIRGEVTRDDVDAILLPKGEAWDAVAAKVQASLDQHGVSKQLVEIVRYDPVVPKEFDTAEWLT